MVNKGSATPGRILDAAEELFADNGIDATSLSAILERAGARNKSAIAYHFGSKFDVLQALIQRHWATIDVHRDRLLDDIESSGAPSLHGLVDAMVAPVAVKLDDASGRRYLQLQAALLSYPRRDQLPDTLLDPTQRLGRLQGLMRQVTDPDPNPDTTRALIVSLIFHGLGDFSRSTPTRAERQAFVAALTDAIYAILRVRERPPATR
jgi:AcrR family transcriptional regulator